MKYKDLGISLKRDEMKQLQGGKLYLEEGPSATNCWHCPPVYQSGSATCLPSQTTSGGCGTTPVSSCISYCSNNGGPTYWQQH